MAAVLQRLAAERPGWKFQIAVRALGAVLLGLCAWAGTWLHRVLAHPVPAGPGLAVFAMALLAVLGWCLGWAFMIEGPGLFRLIPVPDRAFVPFAD